MSKKHEIQDYSFGNIVVDGKSYSKDLIIYPDSIQDSWWRRESHNLVPEDIEEVIERRPEVLVVGTGAKGMLKVPQSTKEHLLSLGIEVVDFPTDRAAKYFNELQEKKHTLGAFHLTC
ncbi:MAG: Mth938-like domain-containing protein [Spirochaetia bacterium]